MKKEDFRFMIFLICLIFVFQIILFLVLIIGYPDQQFTLFVTMLSSAPSIALVIVTFIYVKITYDLLQENQLLRRKSFIEEVINSHLFPILESLRSGTKYIQDGQTFFICNHEVKLRLYQISRVFSGRFPEIFESLIKRHFPDILKKIDEYDKKLVELERIGNEILKRIDNEHFKKQWGKNVNEYEKKETIQLGSLAEILDNILASIINGDKAPMLSDAFWIKYKEEILKERNSCKKEFSKLNKEIDKISDSLMEFKKLIITKIDTSQNEYGFIAKEPMEML